MEYKISQICENLSIGKSTIYKRIETLKKDIPEENLKNNDYFYYDASNKLFITEKGFEFIKNFKVSNANFRQNSTKNDIVPYNKDLIEIYKSRIEFLENENKKLLDIIALKEQKEIAASVSYIDNKKNKKEGILSRFFNQFYK